MEVASLGVDMSDGDSAAQHNIGWDVLHPLVVKGRLEFRAHKAVSVTRIGEDRKVNRKHGRVESKGYYDEAQCACHEMLCPGGDGNGPRVPKEHPQLNQGQAADPSYGAEANPLDAKGNAKA